MAQNIISLGFNVDELSAEKQQVLSIMVDLFGKLKEYDGTKFDPLGGGGLADLKKSITDGAAAMNEYGQSVAKYNQIVTEQAQKQAAAKKTTDDSTISVQQYEKIVSQLAVTQGKNNALTSNAAEALAVEREALKQRNTELSTSARLQQSENGSIPEAKAQVAALTQERDKLNLRTEEGQQRQTELNEKINQFNQFIKENVSVLEQTKINIGNYSASLSGAFESVKDELVGVNKQLAEMETRGKSAFSTAGAAQPIGFDSDRYKGSSNVTALASGSGNQVSILEQDAVAYQKLTLQQKVLEGSLQRQAVGFKTANQEMRAVRNTLDTMTLAGLKDTDAYNKLSVAYTNNEQKVKDLHREQAILTSDAPALTALTGVARGLGGAYAFGAGASQLFSDGTGKLDKELNKLVAIMTFLQGLEQAVAVLKTRNAIVTTLEEEATKALNVVKSIETALFGKSAAAAVQEAAAKDISTESTIANTEASEVNAAGAVVAAAAMDGVTVATEAATVATVSFSTVLVATGIGAIIIGIIYGITKLVGAIEDWATADERVTATQEALNQQLVEYMDTVGQLQDLLQTTSRNRIDDMTKEAKLQSDAGKNQFIQLQNEKKIADERLNAAKKVVDQQKISQSSVDDLYKDQRVALEILGAAEHARSKAQADAGEQNTWQARARLEIAEEDVKLAKGTADVAVKAYEQQYNALKKYSDAKNDVSDADIKAQKAYNDLVAKLQADAAQRTYDLEKDKNDRILGLETSTEAQRISAVRGNFGADAQLAAAQVSAIQKKVKTEELTEQEGADQIANIQNELTIKYRKSVEDREKIALEFRNRNLTAQNSISKTGNQSDSAIQEAITKDTQKELDDRLTALRKNIADKTAIIVNDYNNQVKLNTDLNGKSKLTADEQLAQERDKDAKLKELTADTQKEIYDITLSYGERKLKAIEDLNKSEDPANAVTDQYNQATIALDESLSKNILSYGKYQREKKKLDEQYAIDKADADVKHDQAELKRLNDLLQEEAQSKLKAAEADLEGAKAGGNPEEIKNAQAKVNALKAIQTKYLAEIQPIAKKLGEDQLKDIEAKNKRIIEAEEKLKENVKQIQEQSFELAKQFVDSYYGYQEAKIERSIELRDEQADAEIAAIGRSTLSARAQTEEEIILTAQKKASDNEAKREIKADKIQEAKFDRDLAVAQVVWNTANAVMKDTAGVPFPLSLAVAASDIALGAIQGALILAKPIPTYAEGIGIPGKGVHPGGYGIAGEAGPELISMPGHQPFIVDKATLLDMPTGSSVLPIDTSNIVFDLGMAALLQGTSMINGYQSGSNVEDAIRTQTAQLKKALAKNNRKIVNVIKINTDMAGLSQDYINKKILGKR